MTNDMMTLCGLIENSDNADVLREMIGFAAQRLMELEVESKTGAGYGEKSAERLAYRADRFDAIVEIRPMTGQFVRAYRGGEEISGKALAEGELPYSNVLSQDFALLRISSHVGPISSEPGRANLNLC
jgi:hypothetical protein